MGSGLAAVPIVSAGWVKEKLEGRDDSGGGGEKRNIHQPPPAKYFSHLVWVKATLRD
jgi:hypothetical protein